MLRHPAIAALYEAGRTAEGQHYFAMELVRGEPLKDYVLGRGGDGPAENREDVRWRLDLFVQICHGISYAHQRGVIHRDLKPSNLLVTPHTESSHGSSSDPASRYAVKILDFGLARITDVDESVTLQVSDAGQIKGTLAYMSPEQARGNPSEIDIRTDIYALGVILYEALTGRMPYEISRTLLPEAVRIITEQEPRRPSLMHKALGGDLETIVLRTLDKDPARRYQTVNGLIEDIGRYLTDQPILARPSSAAYQLRKLVARHKAAFAFAVTFALLVTGFTGVSTYMWQIARREGRRADQERERVAEINRGLRTQLDAVSSRQTPADADPSPSLEAPFPDFEPLGVNFAPPTPSSPASVPEPARRPARPPAAGAEPAPDVATTALPPVPVAGESIEGTEVLSALLGQVAFTDQQIFQAATSSSAAGIHILLKEYEQAEALLLSAYPVIMRASVAVEEKVALVKRLAELYAAWGRPEEAERYQRMLAGLR
jgi:serine/threonine protein kinase